MEDNRQSWLAQVRKICVEHMHLLLALAVMLASAAASGIIRDNQHPSTSDDVGDRIAKLDETKKALKDLSSFVDDQKQKLVESEKTLSELSESL